VKCAVSSRVEHSTDSVYGEGIHANNGLNGPDQSTWFTLRLNFVPAVPSAGLYQAANGYTVYTPTGKPRITVFFLTSHPLEYMKRDPSYALISISQFKLAATYPSILNGTISSTT